MSAATAQTPATTAPGWSTGTSQTAAVVPVNQDDATTTSRCAPRADLAGLQMQAAVPELLDAIHACGQLRVVRDNDETRSQQCVELEHQIEHFRAGRPVEIARRLIRQYDSRLGDQRPSNGRALALAAGQLRRPVREPLTEPDASQQRRRALARFGGSGAAHEQRHRNVLQCRELG